MNLVVKRVLVLVAVAWAVVMAIFIPDFIAAHRETKSALLAFDRYSATLVGQDYGAAYALCGTEFQNATSAEDFAAAHQHFVSSLGRLQSVKRDTYEVKGRGDGSARWRAIINASLNYQKEALHFEFELRKSGDQWFVFGAKQI